MKYIAPTLNQAYGMIIQDESQQVATTNMMEKIANKVDSLVVQANSMLT